MSKSKVTNVSHKKSFAGKNGEMQVFVIEFENGDKGEFISRSREQTDFVIGEETEYTLTPNTNPQYLGSVKKPQTGGNNRGGGGYRFSPEAEKMKEKSIARSVALKASVDLMIAGKIEEKNLLPSADKMFAWLTKE